MELAKTHRAKEKRQNEAPPILPQSEPKSNLKLKAVFKNVPNHPPYLSSIHNHFYFSF